MPAPDDAGLPVVREITYRAPEQVFRILADTRHTAWLDSAAAGDPRGRYSYLCIDPFHTLRAGENGDGDPFGCLAAQLASWRLRPGAAPTPFAGGAVGFIGYGLGLRLEGITSRHAAEPGVPAMWFGFYDLLLAFDHLERRCWILSSGFPQQDWPARCTRAAERAAWLQQEMQKPARAPHPVPPVAWRAELPLASYRQQLQRVLDLIQAGDIYQANFTLRHLAERPAALHAPALYERLRAESPAPFAAFLSCDGMTLLSASPERFVLLDTAGRMEARPIKGTRPRDADPARDAALRQELAESEKDRAENLMIADLLRHDLGKLARIGSVRVPQLCAVESFASVHHLVSVVEAWLRPGLGAVDVLRATLPGGSVTGAPKHRAVQIIDALEAAPRGPYCGTITWIGFDGAMDSAIVIRTLVLTPDKIIAQAGGGIVADSDPDREFAEVQTKLRPLLRAAGAEA